MDGSLLYFIFVVGICQKNNFYNFSTLVVPESALLRDLIFIFQGIDGQYIKFDTNTGEYAMDSQVNVPQPTKDLVYRLTEIGWLYRRIQTFIRPRCNDPSAGLVAQV